LKVCSPPAVVRRRRRIRRRARLKGGIAITDPLTAE
jgi:hypothetical protein